MNTAAECYSPMEAKNPTVFYSKTTRHENGKEWIAADNGLWHDHASLRELATRDAKVAAMLALGE